MNAIEEDVLRNRRDGDKRSREGQPCGITLWSEDCNVTIWGAESLHPFVGLLTVVEAWCHAMDTEIWVSDVFGGRPYTSLDTVVGLDVPINCAALVLALEG